MKLPVQGHTITVYQPQPESYADGNVTARAVVAVQPDGKDPVYGAIWMNGFLEVDRNTRMGTLTRLEVTDARFPAVSDTTRITELRRFLSQEVPKHTQPFAIDRLIASLEPANGQRPALKNDAPKVLYEQVPSTLVLIDGDPILQPVENSPYQRVVNSPFLIACTKEGKTCYLGSETFWYSASTATGPWTPTTSVPADLKNLVKKEPEDGTIAVDSTAAAPKVLVSTTPAELLQTKGEAVLQPIQGTQLLYVTNSDNDIFMDIASQQFFALLSGRWYAAPKLGPGGWTYIEAEKLPADFAKIPEGSPKDGVLASVPGTDAAREAVLDASIPQTASVSRTAQPSGISYDGDPKWRLIEGTAIYEAENANTTVLYIRERFYACENAVWYESANATGPRAVCTQVPSEVQEIPPSSPNYNVKYVKVYDTTPDVVVVGYTPGYTGCYVYGPTVVYGTGYYYRPWYGTVYYPPPVTWGFNMHYNPWTGWSMGMTVSNGWMTVHVGGHPGGWWGPPMYRPPYYPPPYRYGGGGYYNRGGNTINIDNSTNINVGGGQGNRPGGGQGGANRPTTRPSTGQGSIYDKGRNPAVQPSRPGGGAATGPGTTAKPGASTKPSGANNMYTDKSGNVYRTDGRNWQQQQPNGRFQTVSPGTQQAGPRRTDGGGQTTARPPAGSGARSSTMTPDTRQQLQRDQAARSRGEQRIGSFQGRPSPGAGGAAPRSGGGTMRGGGGRR